MQPGLVVVLSEMCRRVFVEAKRIRNKEVAVNPDRSIDRERGIEKIRQGHSSAKAAIQCIK